MIRALQPKGAAAILLALQRFPFVSWVLLAAGSSAGSVGCSDCDRSGCSAYAAPASPPISQGVAGVVAHQSDVVEDGCQGCGFTSAQLNVWQTPALVQTEAELTATTATEASLQIGSGAHYYQPLDAAHYLVCVSQFDPPAPCASFTVAPERVTTVNVKRRDGTTSLLIFDANSTLPRAETTTFSAPTPVAAE